MTDEQEGCFGFAVHEGAMRGSPTDPLDKPWDPTDDPAVGYAIVEWSELQENGPGFEFRTPGVDV